MIAKLPTLPPAAAPRADQALSSAESKQQTQRQTSFEHALSHRQRTQRQRDDAADAPVIDRPVSARSERADSRRSERAEAAKSPGNQPLSTEAAPADAPDDLAELSQEEAAIAPALEREASTDEVTAQAADVVEELPAQEPEPTDQAAPQNSIDALASELVQQVTQAIAAPTQANVASEEAATVSAGPATATIVKKPETTAQTTATEGELASTLSDTAVETDAKPATHPLQAIAIENDGPATSPTTNAAASAAERSEAIDSSRQGGKSAPAPLEAPAITVTAGAASSSNASSAGEALSAQLAQLPQGDEAQVRDQINMGRLTRGLSSAVNQRGGSVTLRLTPPELGLVRIDMAVREGVVNAKFTAQSESVRNLLMDQMGQLRHALDRQGLSVDKIEVQVTLQSSAGGFDRHSDDMNRDGRSAGQYQSSRDGRGDSPERRGSQRADRDTFDRALANVTP